MVRRSARARASAICRFQCIQTTCQSQMRAFCLACRKVLRHASQHSHNEGIAARKQARVILDRNDVFDIKAFITASSCTFTTSADGKLGKTGLDIRQLFRQTEGEAFQIAAHWAALDMDSKDAAYGAILGAFVGDAAGGVLEFMDNVTADKVEAALQMPGGGCWNLGPGQITDDSEMALCLLHGLLDCPASGPLPLDAIAHWFTEWLRSPPFDVGMSRAGWRRGMTTQTALRMEGSADHTADLGARMVANAAKHNQSSQSNGCLMRLTPLAVWAHQQPVEVIARHAMDETALTHPNKIAQVGTAAYCIAIAHLINHTRDARGAIAAVTAWLHSQQAPDVAQAADTVLDWLSEARAAGPGPRVYKNMGFMRWGFVHAFRALHLELQYVDAMKHVLLLGGDTDTNAAIVGGLLGAYWGASSLPGYLTGPVLAFGPLSGGRKRPSFLHAKQLPQLFEQLWQVAKA